MGGMVFSTGKQYVVFSETFCFPLSGEKTKKHEVWGLKKIMLSNPIVVLSHCALHCVEDFV